MKKIILLFALAFSIHGFSQCVVDTSLNTVGIFPQNGTSTGFYVYMPDATEGVAYNEMVQILAPADTTIDTLGTQITADIDSIKIVEMINLPTSLQYACNTSNCLIEGGENGCAVFTGVPGAGDVGNHVVTVRAVGWINIGFFGTISDTIEFTLEIKVNAKMGIEEFISSGSVKMQPNPFTDVAQLSFQAVKEQNFNFNLVDITGRVVDQQRGNTILGENTIAIKRNDLPSGMYFYTLEVAGNALAGKVIITD